MSRAISDQVVVVVGAASGIGRATALQFAREGARVAVAARDGDALDELASEAKATPGEILALPADARDAGQLDDLASTVADRWGRIDTWVNAAAVHEYAWFEDTTPAEFTTVVETNLLGQVYGAYAALPQLAANPRGGVLIGVASVESIRAVPLQAAYCASKFGLRGFYDVLRMECAQRHPKVHVTTILPAAIDTPLFEHARSKLGHLPKPPPPLYAPEVVARAIVFAAGHPRREIPVGGSALAFVLGQRFAPAAMDWLLSRRLAAVHLQQSELPDSPRDNLDRPIVDDRTRGRVGQTVGSVRERSPFTELVWQHPAVRRGLLAGGLAALGWAIAR